MTIQDLIRELGVSKSSVYRFLCEDGVSLDDLREENSKHLTQNGIAIIVDACAKRGKGKIEQPTAEPADAETVPDETEADSTGTNSAAADAIPVQMAVELARLQERVASLEREKEFIREQLAKAEASADTWRGLYETERRNSQVLLLASAKRPNIFRRVLSAIKGDTDGTHAD